MKILYKTLLISIAFLTTVGCGDFLSENATNRAYVNNIDDVNELILGEGYMEPKVAAFNNMAGLKAAIPGWIHVMDDDSKMNNNSASNSKLYCIFGPFHYWMQNPCIDPTSLTEYEDYSWIKLYRHINAMNVIIYELDSRFSADKYYNKYKGEALFLRALYYFYLVNIYGQPYNPANNGSDLGVPVKLSEVVEDKDFERGTVQDVYKVIISDLKNAITLLKGVTQNSIYRPNECAAHHLLSRAYLYTCQWDECIEQCNEVFKSSYTLSDFTTMTETDSRVSAKSSEVFFSNGENRLNSIFRSFSLLTGGSKPGGGSVSGAVFKVSDELVDLYDKENDTRFNSFEYMTYKYKPNMMGYFPTYKLLPGSDGIVSDCCTFRLAETYLNKAEALVMKGGGDVQAIESLMKLRIKRFKIGSNYNITATGSALLKVVRDERRRELCFEGHRWFDLRRYAVSPQDPINKQIIHYVDEDRDGNDDSHFVLTAFNTSEKGGNWAMPIPEFELLQNNGVLVNNNRSDAEKINGTN